MSKTVVRLAVTALVAALVVTGMGAAAFLGTAAAAGRAGVVAGAAASVVFHGGPGVRGQVGLEAAAQALGMTVDELRTQLRAGRTLADLADAAGVDVQTVLDAMDAAVAAAQRTAIEEAVTDGTITRAHADWLLEGLDAGYWGGNAHGMGMGPRGLGPGGFGPGGVWPGRGRGPANDS